MKLIESLPSRSSRPAANHRINQDHKAPQGTSIVMNHGVSWMIGGMDRGLWIARWGMDPYLVF